MDKVFDIYVVFGEYRVDREDGRSYHKVPLSANLSIAQAQFDWQQFEKHRTWLPEGGIYVNCYMAPRVVELYPEEG